MGRPYKLLIINRLDDESLGCVNHKREIILFRVETEIRDGEPAIAKELRGHGTFGNDLNLIT